MSSIKKSSPQTTWDTQQWFLLGTSVLFFLVAGAFKLPLELDPSIKLWGFNILLKVALVLLAAALAWPQLKRLKESSYGRVMLVGLLIAAIFFLIRPKAMTAILPMIAIGVVLFLVLTFVRNLFLPPKG